MADSPWGSMGMHLGAPPERLTEEFYHNPPAMSIIFGNFAERKRRRLFSKNIPRSDLRWDFTAENGFFGARRIFS